ncbi:MAG: hypothetical protein ACK528_00360 [Alphaproteobacteria bacterium]|jgi:hypothetical protein
MKAEIIELNDFIQTTGVFSRWGKLCVNKTDKGMPYGIGTESDCAGNIFGYDDLIPCTGYMFVNQIVSKLPTPKTVELDVEVHINIFTPHKQIGELTNYFSKPLDLLGRLVRNRYNARFVQQNSNRYSFQEVATIAVNLRVFVPCESITYNSAIC